MCIGGVAVSPTNVSSMLIFGSHSASSSTTFPALLRRGLFVALPLTQWENLAR